MKFLKSLSMIVLVAMWSLNTATAQTNVKVDVTSSKINWNGKKVVGEHSGTIKIKDGSLSFTEGVLTGGSFAIDMTSITNTDMDGGMADKLVGHLKSDDFFGVDSHPTSNLVITAATPTSDGYAVTGDLTIKGTTKPVSFNVTAGKYLANAIIKIDRTAYDIKYGSGSFFENLGDKAIDNEFTLDVSLVLVANK